MAEHSITSTDPLELELTYNTGRIALFNANDQIGPAVYLSNNSVKSAERVSEAYLHAGPGLHIIEEDETLKAFESSIRSVSKHLPRVAIRYGTMEEETSDSAVRFVYFGNLAIRGRRADEPEVSIAKEEARAYRALQEQQRREIIAAKDSEKTDYSNFDHAHVQIGQSRFFLSFDLPQSILAFRTLQYLNGLDAGELFYIGDMDKALWSAMPITERSLLDIKESSIYSATPRPIASMTRNIIYELGWQLGLLTETHQRTKTPIELELRALPDVNNYAGEAVPIVPPGTPRRTLDMMRDQTKGVPTEVLNTLCEQLSALIEKPHWEQKDAVDMLDIIMSAEGKVALFQLHGRVGRQTKEQYAQSEDAIGALHKRICRTLGEDAYHGARQQRIVGGNRVFGSKEISVRQSGGKINDSDIAAIDRLRRWTIGKPQTLKNRTFSIRP